MNVRHFCNKINAERARQQTTQQPAVPDTAPPPPYSGPTEDNGDEGDEEGEDDDDDDGDATPLTLTINAAQSIRGSQNLIPTSPTPLADASRFSAVLLAAMKQLHRPDATTASSSPLNHAVDNQIQPSCRYPISIAITINCGVTVVGDRNVIGHVAIRPKAPGESEGAIAPALIATPTPTTMTTTTVPPQMTTTESSAAVMGAKRKAEGDEDEQHEAKKVAVEGAGRE